MLSSAEFGQLRAFIAVAEALSFSQAAARLGISVSALSQMVRGLEKRVGTRLLNRTTRSVSLTAAGTALLERVQPAAGELEAAMDQARRSQTRPAGLVRIHCFRRAATLFLAPMLRAFTEAYPDIVLDVTSDDTVVDMVAGGYDAAIRVGEVIERDMIALRLGPDMQKVIVASPDYLSRHGLPVTPRDLREHRCIRWRWQGRAAPEPWELWGNGRWFGVAVDGPLIVSDRDLETLAAVAGIGLACTVADRVCRPCLRWPAAPGASGLGRPVSRLLPVLPPAAADGAGPASLYRLLQGLRRENPMTDEEAANPAPACPSCCSSCA